MRENRGRGKDRRIRNKGDEEEGTNKKKQDEEKMEVKDEEKMEVKAEEDK